MAEDSSDPPVQPFSTLPPYPEVILTAIQELNDKNGSNKSSISKQIESTYGELPPAHATLLTHHLNKMKQSGQLTLLKNNYLICDPNSPPRRGRGRPPKPKSADALTIPSGPPRPRGRPPKAVDPADASAALAVSPRPRGRPPKVVDPNAPPRPPKSASSGRGRGRPPKIAQTGGGVPSQAAITGVKRGRGRPPKVKTAVALVGV